MVSKGEITLLAVGDLRVERDEPRTIFDGVRSILTHTDILLGNQEAVTSDRGQPIIGKEEVGSRVNRSVPGLVPVEAELGFSAMTLANNHIMDWGNEGLFQTMELMQTYGIPFTGAGANYAEARRPVFLEKQGVKIAMLGYTSVYPQAGYVPGPNRPGVATVKAHTAFQPSENIFYQPGYPPLIITMPDQVELEAMLADIRRVRQSADLVIVQLHWGVAQGWGRVSGYMKEMGRAAVDAGADLVIGHHPHLLLGFEFYKERLICYSINHFAFESFLPWRNWIDTLVLKAIIRDGRFARYSVLPMVIDEPTRQPHPAHGEDWQRIQRSLGELSKEYGTSFTAEDEELVLGGPVPGTPEPLRAPEVYVESLLYVPWPTSRGKGVSAFFEGGKQGSGRY